MKNVLMIVGLMALGFTATAQKWSVDKAHSKVGFSVVHLMLSDVEGSFKLFNIVNDPYETADLSTIEINVFNEIANKLMILNFAQFSLINYKLLRLLELNQVLSQELHFLMPHF